MTAFKEYSQKYETIMMERTDDRILKLTFHTNGGPLQWGHGAHQEWPEAFGQVAADQENKVVIMTGTGDAFSGPRGTPASGPQRPPAEWDATRFEGIRLLTNLLAIEAPIISAVNGPALRHMEVPLLSDVVLATEDTVFQDSGHFPSHTVPGDGIHIVMPLLMGLTRGRYFLLTGQELSAAEARDVGLVNEIVPREQLLSRAWEIATDIAAKPDLVVRYTRVLLTQHIKRMMLDLLGYGLSLEGAASADRWTHTRAGR